MLKKITLSILIIFFLLLCSVIGFFLYKKDSIKKDVIRELNKSLKVEVLTKDIEVTFFDYFPKVSIVFRHLRIKDKNNNIPDLCGVKKLSISFNVLDLLDKKIDIKYLSLDTGYINIFNDKSGRANYDIFKGDGVGFSKNIRRLNLRNINFVYENKEKATRYPLLIRSLKASKFTLINDSIKSLIHCKSAFMFNKDGQSWIHALEKKDINVDFSFIYKSGVYNISINKVAKLVIDKYPIDVKGNISLEKQKNSIISFNFLDEVPIQLIDSYLPTKLDKYTRYAIGENGKVIGSGVVKYNFIDSKLISLDIKRINYNDNNGKVNGMIKYKANNNGILKTNLSYLFDSKVLTKIPESKKIEKYIRFKKGSFKGKLAYQFTLNIPVNEQVNTKIYQLKADISFDKVKFYVPAFPFHFSNAKGSIKLDKNKIDINKSTFNYNNKNFVSNVSLSAFKDWLFNGKSPNIKIDLATNSIDKSDLVLSNTNGSNVNKGINPYLPNDDLLPFLVNVDIKKLTWDKYNLRNVKSSIFLQPNQVDINNTSFMYSGGKVVLNCLLKTHHKDKRYTNFKIGINSKAISLSQLFYTSDNFKQKFIQDKHLDGKLSTATSISAIINPNRKVLKRSINGYIDFTITDGVLKNFEPLQVLTKYLPKSNFNRVRFGQITERISISDEEVIIPNLLVKNSVRNFEISGKHGFNQAIMYKLKVPIRANEQVNKINSASNSIKGMSLHFNILGTSDDYDVILEKKKIKEEIKKVFVKEKEEWAERKAMGGKSSNAKIRINKDKDRIQ